ncbi:hypothetical protein [Paraburkholderia hospita]|jgi:hypothetical protein|uniref:hypothetical protein n=1 Tax=Paraburkholderia hospita TaxID=169430 RepID=UPI000271D7B3|nr:hypothetical protein [Paraburkholderia hospita]EUC18614.1 hypothetical protein PMI06_003239 [Burkholderia sp. BT03]SKC60168.1 hypothetical protein SAMN06266956_1093 [Paraburkholderia hospita]
MAFEKEDSQLQREIIAELDQRRTINANRERGVMYMQAELEDKINPTVLVTRDDIRGFTLRDKVRDVVMSDYEKALSVPGIEVTRIDNDTLKVTIAPIPVPSNEFKSLAELRRKNAVDLEADPELGDSPY